MSVKYTSHKAECEQAIRQAKARALEICGGTAERYAKQYCPVDTGNLRNSIAHAQVSENTEQIGTTVYYAPYVELGTCKMSARPFLRPAVENHRQEYENIIKSELGSV